MDLKGSKTEQNLKDALRVNPKPIAAISISHQKQTSKATTMSLPVPFHRGRRDRPCTWSSGVPGSCRRSATGLPIGATADNLKAAVAGETHEYTDMYPGMAKPPVKRGLTRSPIGSKHWPKPSASRQPLPESFERIGLADGNRGRSRPRYSTSRGNSNGS